MGTLSERINHLANQYHLSPHVVFDIVLYAECKYFRKNRRKNPELKKDPMTFYFDPVYPIVDRYLRMKSKEEEEAVKNQAFTYFSSKLYHY
ncbi:MAG: hypothetical protein QW594_02165 [Candidatus Woesearchaeota archaeon]